MGDDPFTREPGVGRLEVAVVQRSAVDFDVAHLIREREITRVEVAPRVGGREEVVQVGLEPDDRIVIGLLGRETHGGIRQHTKRRLRIDAVEFSPEPVTVGAILRADERDPRRHVVASVIVIHQRSLRAVIVQDEPHRPLPVIELRAFVTELITPPPPTEP